MATKSQSNTKSTQLDNIQAAFNGMYTEIAAEHGRNAEIRAKVDRLERKVDYSEFLSDDIVDDRELAHEAIRALANLHVSNQIANVRQNAPPPVSAFRINQTEKRRRLVRKKLLMSLGQVVTPKCPCGSHKGIAFIRPDGSVEEENVCPMKWWLNLSHIAFETGTERPKLEDYLKTFRLEKK